MKLERLAPVPLLLQDRWAPYVVPGLDTIHYVKDFLSPDQVVSFTEAIEKQGEWESMATRDTQEYGGGLRCPCGRGLLKQGLPVWQHDIVEALHAIDCFHPVLYPA